MNSEIASSYKHLEDLLKVRDHESVANYLAKECETSIDTFKNYAKNCR
jgi:hypothetical protein